MTSVSSANFGREIRAISLVGFGHFLSHFYMFGLVPLFVAISTDLNVTNLQLGAILTAYNIATGVLQTPMGILVDKFGARRVLISGLFVTSSAFGLCGFTTAYWELLMLFFVAGAGNSVFHPADYVILTASVDQSRQGRAYSMHSFGGSLGTAAGPAVMAILMTMTDWRTALVIAGLLGVVLSLIFVFSGDTLQEDAAAKQKTKSEKPLRSMITRSIVLLFLFYVLTSSANIGLTAFAPIYLPALYNVTVETAAYILSALLFSNALGTLFGGWLADKTPRHELVLVISFTIYSVVLVIVGTALIPVLLVVGAFMLGGFVRGIVNPSRDMMVRQLAPAGALGTVFAFVSTGFNVGQGLAPLAYGALLDRNFTNEVLYLSATFMVASILLLLFSRNRSL
ncbi:MAG: putative sulfoacetate transporter SauU [Alphaproteobacteria bacterium MarineAlpha11_Bin1]|nr:MAG: putative sulfoacetate transporter SauU [Alphaproteobacteria bacterium MarineAlpha11_Bin1]